MKTINKIILTFILSLSITSLSYWYDISEIEVVNDKKLNLSIDSQDIILSQWELNSEIKVLKDINVDFSARDFNDSKKVSISLQSWLNPNSSYNLLSVSWTDWSIDFSLKDNLNSLEIDNSSNLWDEQWISKIVVQSENSIDVYFNKDLEEDEFEFKILKELNVESVSSSDAMTIDVNLEDKLDASSNYIVMVISLEDSVWKEVIFTQWVYDFVSWEELASSEDLEENNEDNIAVQDEDNSMEEDQNNLEDSMLDLVVLDQEESSQDEDNSMEENSEDNIENVALNSASTPDTWAETWVLILGTLFINTFLTLRKRLTRA